MLRELSARPEWLSLPIPSLEAWKQALSIDLGLAAAATAAATPPSPPAARTS
jgi:hypothetical protein